MADKPQDINPFAQFVEQPKQEPNPFEKYLQDRTWGEALVTDPLTSFLKGVGSTISSPGQVTSLLTGEKPPTEKAKGTTQSLLDSILPFGTNPSAMPEKVLDKLTPTAPSVEGVAGAAVNPFQGLNQTGEELQAFGKRFQSTGLTAREKELASKINEANGFFNEAGVAVGGTLTDPALLSDFIFAQMPNFAATMGGGTVSRGLVKTFIKDATEKTLSRAGVTGAVATAAAMQGGDIGSETYQSIYDRLVKEGMDQDKAHEIALEKARIAGAQGAAISVATTFIPGGKALEKRFLTEAGKRAGKTSVASKIGNVIGETLQESTEEGGGKLASNVQVQSVFPETDIMKGVGAAAGQGALGGGFFGGLSNLPSRPRATQADIAKALGIPESVAGAPAKIEESQLEEETPVTAGKPTDSTGVRPSVTPVTVENEPVTMTLYRGVQAGKEGQPTVGGGLFMSPDRSVAEMYAGKDGKITESKVTFNNLLSAKDWLEARQKVGLSQSNTMEDLVNKARDLGYDGITFNTTNGQEVISIPEVKLPKNEVFVPVVDDNGDLTDQKDTANLDKLYFEDGQVWVEGAEYDHELSIVLDEIKDEAVKADLIKRAEAVVPKATEVVKEEAPKKVSRQAKEIESDARWAWYELSDEERIDLQDYLTSVLDARGKVNVLNIPEEIRNKLDTGRTTILNKLFDENPQETIAALTPKSSSQITEKEKEEERVLTPEELEKKYAGASKQVDRIKELSNIGDEDRTDEENDFLDAARRELYRTAERISGPPRKKGYVSSSHIDVNQFGDKWVSGSTYMGSTGGYGVGVSYDSTPYDTREEAINAEIDKMRSYAESQKDTVTLKWLDSLDKRKPKVLTKEEKAAENRKRQEEKRIAAQQTAEEEAEAEAEDESDSYQLEKDKQAEKIVSPDGRLQLFLREITDKDPQGFYGEKLTGQWVVDKIYKTPSGASYGPGKTPKNTPISFKSKAEALKFIIDSVKSRIEDEAKRTKKPVDEATLKFLDKVAAENNVTIEPKKAAPTKEEKAEANRKRQEEKKAKAAAEKEAAKKTEKEELDRELEQRRSRQAAEAEKLAEKQKREKEIEEMSRTELADDEGIPGYQLKDVRDAVTKAEKNLRGDIQVYLRMGEDKADMMESLAKYNNAVKKFNETVAEIRGEEVAEEAPKAEAKDFDAYVDEVSDQIDNIVDYARMDLRTGITREEVIKRLKASYEESPEKAQGILDNTEANMMKAAKERAINDLKVAYYDATGKYSSKEADVVRAIKSGIVDISNNEDADNIYKLFDINKSDIKKVSTEGGVPALVDKFEGSFFGKPKDVSEDVYDAAAKQFLESTLKAKVPTGKMDSIDPSRLKDVTPQPIEKTIKSVDKTFEDQAKVLYQIASKEDIRYYLKGINVDIKKGRLVATDGHRAAIINDASLKDAPKPPSGSTVYTKDNKYIDAQYPDIDRVIPKHADNKVTVTVKPLGDHARGANKAWRYISSKMAAPIQLSIGDTKMSFNAKYIEDMTNVFRQLGYDTAEISITDSGRLFATSPDGKVQQVIMSLRDEKPLFADYSLGSKTQETARRNIEADQKREEESRFNAVIDATVKATEAQLKRDIADKKISLADARKMLEAFPNYPEGVIKPYTIRLIEKRAGAEPSFKKLRNTITEDGFKIQNPMMAGLVDDGYEMLDLRNPRTYVDKNGTPHRTFEKNGVRIALTSQEILFQTKGQENRVPQIGVGNEDDIHFNALLVDPELRKQGLAKKALKDITFLADKHKLNVYLEPAQLEESGMTKEQLSKLYGEFLWKPTNDSGKVMKRVPESYEEKMDRIDAELKAEGREHEMTRAARELAEVKAKVAELQKQKIIEKEVNKLSNDEINKLEDHYGERNDSMEFAKRVRDDAVKYINQGAEAVDKAIRSIIAKVAAAILSVAIVFNPNYMSDASAVALPQVVTKTVQATVPTNVKGMSESGQKAYAILYPALKQGLQKNNKYFTVIDKPTSKAFVFNPDGSLMTQSNVVLGKAFGDFYVGKTDFKQNRITPGGNFIATAEKGSATYDGKTVYTIGNEKEGWNVVFMHTVYLKENDAKDRLQALETGEGTRLSHGCVNGPTDLMQKIDNPMMDKSHVFIVPDNQAAVDDFIANRVSNEDLTRETVTPVTEKVPVPTAPKQGQKELFAREEEAEKPPKTQAEINRERQQRKQAMLKAESPYYGSFTNNIDEASFKKTREQIKKEKSESSRKVKHSLTKILRTLAKGEASIKTQRDATEMLDARTELNKEKKYARVRMDSAIWFAKQADEDAELHKAYPNDPKYGLEPEVAAVIRDVATKYPKLLEGLKLSIKKSGEDGTAGNFNPFARLVTLFKDTSGTSDPKTFRHEVMHSIEQMMPDDVYQMVIDNWAKSLGKAIAKHTDGPHKAYFDAVLDYVENPTEENKRKAEVLMPSYEMYQYMNPSEFWAVNAEKLFASKLGGRWENFKRAISKLFEGLKSVFGFNNTYGVHKAFDRLFKGPMERGESKRMLVDYIMRNNPDAKYEFLSNFEEYDNRREEEGRSEAIIKTSPSVLDRFLGAFKGAKRTWKHVIANPAIPTSNMGGKLARALTYVRVKNVWYAKGLEVLEAKKYGGQLRDGMNKAIASVAVTNALHAGHIGSEVILRGKLIFNEASQMFQAVRDKFSMANVMMAKHDLIERVGLQRANNMIQDYFEAKRSRSIIEEFLKREGEFAELEAAYEAAVTDEEKSKLRKELVEAEKGLKAIDVARKKVNMDDEQIDFYSSLEDENPELRTMMDNWTAVNHNMIDNMEMSNLISKKRAAQLRSIKDYVPWYRIKDNMEEVHSPAGAVRSLTNVAQEKKFGDYETDLDIDDIVDNMLHNVMVLTRNSIRNHAANQVAMAYATRNEKGKIVRFGEEGIGPNGEVRTNVVINGKRTIIEIQDPLVAQSVLGMESVAIPGLEIFGMIANNLRRGVTLWPQFQLKQLFMDAPTAAWVSGVKNPHAVYADTFRSFIKALRSSDPVVDMLKSYGIGGYQSVHRAPEQMYKQKIGLLEQNKLDKLTSFLDRVSDSSDYAQRIAIYNRVMKETNGDQLQAIMQANNVIDFMKHGSGTVAQALSRTVSFMNAYAQQIDVLAETLAGGGFKGKSRAAALAQMAKTGGLLAFYAMIYCWMVGDDDEYQKLDDQTKLRNFFISKKITGLKEDLLIPMSTSASFFFKSIPELTYNTIITRGTKNEHDAARVRRALAKAAGDALLGPNPIPTGVKPFVEVIFDHNFLTGGTVTPQGLKGLDSAEQYNASTSELGKVISAVSFGALNPIQADHLVRGLFGTTGTMVMYGLNLFNGERATPQAKDNPMYGGLVAPDVARGPEDLFYDLKERAEKADKTFNKLHERGRHKQADKYFDENKALIEGSGYTTDVGNALKEINKEIRRLGESAETGMTADQRRERIKDLQLEKSRILDEISRYRRESGL